MKTKSVIMSASLAAIAAAALLTAPAFAQPGGMRGDRERPTFAELDADGDGSVTIAEMKAQATAKFAERDANGDGVLSSEELVAGMMERAAEGAGRMIEWRDTDGDGSLSQAELGGGFGQQMFARLDADNDGSVSAEEFETAAERGGLRGKGKARGGRHNNR